MNGVRAFHSVLLSNAVIISADAVQQTRTPIPTRGRTLFKLLERNSAEPFLKSNCVRVRVRTGGREAAADREESAGVMAHDAGKARRTEALAGDTRVERREV